MKRAFALSVLVAALVLATAATALAGFTWCSTDPNIKLPSGGGVFHLVFSVPEEFADTPFDLAVWAPAGSEVVGHFPKVNVNNELNEGSNGQVTAAVVAGFPVQLGAKYRGNDLETFEFGAEGGTAFWSW